MDETHFTKGEAPDPDRPAYPRPGEARPDEDYPARPLGGRFFAQDRQYLNLLAIFHFVLAGLAFLFSFCPLLYIGMGIFIISGGLPPPPTTPQGPPGPPPALIGWIIIGEFGFFLVMLYGSAILACLVGQFLRRRKRWLFCVVASGIQCLFMPFGTCLGVFTIIVLARESVKDVFQHGEPVTTTDEDYA